MIDEAQARTVIERHTDSQPRTVREMSDGFGHMTFIADDHWVFRFAKTPAVAQRDRLESRLLPVIDTSVTFAVPTFEHFGDVAGTPYVGYRLIPGRPLEADDVPDLISPSALAHMLHELHSVDTARAATILHADPSRAAWEGRYRDLHARANRELAGSLAPDQLTVIDAAFERFFAVPFEVDPVLVHADLGTSHILVDDTARIVGMIDFEAAAIGDPAIDFIGLLITLGPDACRTVIDAYPGNVDEGFWERLLGYWWMGSLHAVLHSVATSDRVMTRAATKGLSARLAGVAELTQP